MLLLIGVAFFTPQVFLFSIQTLPISVMFLADLMGGDVHHDHQIPGILQSNFSLRYHY